jgi:hypothetical protein
LPFEQGLLRLEAVSDGLSYEKLRGRHFVPNPSGALYRASNPKFASDEKGFCKENLTHDLVTCMRYSPRGLFADNTRSRPAHFDHRLQKSDTDEMVDT